MNALRVAVIAGTSDGTELIQKIGTQYDVTAFAATAYGAEILRSSPCTVHVGRLDAVGFSAALCGFDAVVDASHPFAVEVSRILQNVCQELQLPCLRLLRSASHDGYAKIIRVASKEEAAAWLCSHEGNILLTTGVNTLGFYAESVTHFAERGWARVLDTAESRKMAAHAAGHIVYGMPPFSTEDTLELLKSHEISVLVTKDSGARGGVPEKIAAAEIYGIPVVLIQRPEERAGMTEEAIQAALLHLAEAKAETER